MAKDFTFGASPEHLKRLLLAGLDEAEPDVDAGAPTSLQDWVEGPGTRIGHYRLARSLGEGGMGIVYLADQEHPMKRQVALKIIKPGMDTKQVIARIEAERQALALLDHPNVAHVYDAGTTAGRPYFVMEYVKGVPITEHCDRQKLTIEQRLQLFLGVCEAIQHAHQKGIIHRDIKPSNILVHMEGDEAVPKVIDFGIAKALSQTLTERTLVTEQGHFVGTPEYMSPEQAQASGQDTDTRSDIYSLGVVLYELLAGVLPFDPKALRQGGPDHARKVIREEEPKTPSRQLTALGKTAAAIAANRQTEVHALTRRLHKELEWIPLKAMRKDPARRYRSASELADDIRNYLDGRPLIAGPETVAYRVRKFVRRNRVVVAAGAAVVAVLVLGIVGSTWQAVRATRAEQRETEARKQAEAQAYASDIKLAQEALAKDNLGEALSILNRHRPRVGETDLRGWEWRYLWNQCRGDPSIYLPKRVRNVHSLAVSADGRWLAVGDYGTGTVSISDLGTQQETVRLEGGDEFVRVAFSPASAWLAFSCVSGSATEPQCSIRLWDGTLERVVKELPLDGRCCGLGFSGDGRTLVTFTETTDPQAKGEIALWAMPEGNKVASYPMPSGSRESITNPYAVAPDLSATAYDYGGIRAGPRTIRLLDLLTGRDRWSVESTDQGFMALAFAPDAKTVAATTANAESRIRLLDAATGKDIGELDGHQATPGALVFWPDGKKLASGGYHDAAIRLWDVPTQRQLGVLRCPGAVIRSLALLPDRTTLVSAAEDGLVRLWDTSKLGSERHSCHTLPRAVKEWTFVGSGEAVMTLDRDGRVARWQGSDFQDEQPLVNLGANTVGGRFSRDGRLVAAGSTNGVVEVWDLEQRVRLHHLKASTGTVRVLGFLAQGQGLITLHLGEAAGPVRSSVPYAGFSRLALLRPEAASVHEWDLKSGNQTRRWRTRWPADTFAVAQSPDERWLLALGFGGTIWLGDSLTGRERTSQLDITCADEVAFSWDGKLFAVSSWGQVSTAKVWDTGTLQEVSAVSRSVRGYYWGLSVAFTPDRKRLATGSEGKRAVTLWDIESKKELLAVAGEGSNFWRSEFSPDGNVLASENMKGVLHLWRAPSWAQIEAAEEQETANGLSR